MARARAVSWVMARAVAGLGLGQWEMQFSNLQQSLTVQDIIMMV